ncbi:MAG: hypothetical protein JNM28_01350 [Armatimonadetes bacterium]|nr:hypothetical protein [Armatimonadota bacterium]
MDNRNKKIVGLTTLAVAVSLTAIVYAQATVFKAAPANPQPAEKANPASQPPVSLAVNGDEVYLYKDQELIVLDRATLQVKQSHSFRPHGPMNPVVVMPPEESN